MYTTEVTTTLSKYIENKELSSFFDLLKSNEEDPAVGSLMQDIINEWQKLQVAKKNGLMDDEQIYFAIRAFFNRKKNEIPGLLEAYSSGKLDS